MPTAFGYARVSTDKQVESGAGIDAQKAAIRQHYDANLKPIGFDWADFYVDPAVSGSVPFNNRPAAGDLAKRMQKGDRIVIAKWDRAFRSMRDMCTTVEGWVAHGVRASVLDMPVDISTDEGMLIAQMFTAIAEFERKRMRQRIREALATRKAQGRPVNRFAGHGFKWVRNGSGRKHGLQTSTTVGLWPASSSFVCKTTRGRTFTSNFSSNRSKHRRTENGHYHGSDVRTKRH